MKKKKRKRRQSARQQVRAVHAKRLVRVNKQKIERASPPWLRILSNGSEDDPISDFSRGLSLLRNGRRQPRDLDMYTPEDNSRTR